MAAPTEEAATKTMKVAPQIKRGIVKNCLSGDCVVIRGKPRGGPPPEMTVAFSGVTAPKLARRPTTPAEETAPEEPFAWESREFLRKKIVGKEVLFTEETVISAGTRSYGTVYLPPNSSCEDLSQCENLTKMMISAGLVTVRDFRNVDEAFKQLEDEAKSKQVNLHSDTMKSLHIRRISWAVEEPRRFTDSLHQKELTAVIEFVVNASTFRAFLLPTDETVSFQYITILLSGVRAPSSRPGETKETFEEEAKFYVESRLLQRDVKVILEGVNNNNLVGSVIHPNGNIAELLLKEGFARCVDWSMGMVSGGPEKLRAAEKVAKDRRVRIWKDYAPSGPQIDSKDKNFVGTVSEIVSADTLIVKTQSGELKRISLASVRPPRPDAAKESEIQQQKTAANSRVRPLYDVPYMFEAREFLRKKTIGKKVNVTVDYIQPASELPERVCCSVMIGGTNLAEALVSKGLCSVVRYRMDDDQRSSHYDDLMAAESRAEKNALGIHSRKAPPAHKVADISGDVNKSKQFLPSLQRAGRLDALVEYVASGSRVRVYIPRETCLITFLLSGIDCPKGERFLPSTRENLPAEPFGEEALRFTKDQIMQREVEIEIESMDRGGNFIGYLFHNGVNISEALIREGLAKLHFTAEKGNYYRQLKTAEDVAKGAKLRIYENFVEEEPKPVEEDEEEKSADKGKSPERKAEYKAVVVTDINKETFNISVQFVDDGPKLEKLMEELNDALKEDPPLPGAYTPKRSEVCSAKFEDGLWYRAKVEKVNSASKTATVFYVDYGNKANVSLANEVALLPSRFSLANTSAMAREFGLACATIPEDDDSKNDAFRALAEDATSASQILLNIEYDNAGVLMATILNASNKEDVVKGLIGEGYLLHDRTKGGRRLYALHQEYQKAQESAKEQRLNIWRYGDFTGDDAKEFGMGAPRAGKK